MLVAHRLYLLIAAALAGLAAVAALGAVQMQRVYDATNFTNVNVVPSLLALDDAFNALDRLQARSWQAVVQADPAQQPALRPAMQAEHAKIAAALDLYEREYIADAHDRALLQAVRAALADYDGLLEQVAALQRAGQAEAARTLLLDQQVRSQQLLQAFDRHRQYNAELGRQGAAQASAILDDTRWLLAAIALAVAAALAALGLLLVRSLLRQLGGEPSAVAAVAGRIAGGDLAVAIALRPGDRSSLLYAVQHMRDSLAAIVAQVRGGTDAMVGAASQIASGNLDLSERTQRQAMELASTASSMADLSGAVQQTADSARQARQLAVLASDVAGQGGAIVTEVVATMGAIEGASGNIAEIIEVIDGIAFQTNILALNAAVEAARAGEHGRGFATVAAEVRNLAQRSAAASSQIKQLIGDSSRQVQAGARLVGQAGATMDDILRRIAQVTALMQDISAASQEQTGDLLAVSQAMGRMDQATQQNASMVEEAAAATQAMQQQAAGLAQLVSVFRLRGGARRDQAAVLSA